MGNKWLLNLCYKGGDETTEEAHIRGGPGSQPGAKGFKKSPCCLAQKQSKHCRSSFFPSPYNLFFKDLERCVVVRAGKLACDLARRISILISILTIVV